jgi:hypothetical protein
LKRSTPGFQKGRMKKRVRVMQKYSKEGSWSTRIKENEYNRDTSSRRPSTFKQQRSIQS